MKMIFLLLLGQTITGPSTVPVHSLVRFSIDDLPADPSTINWIVTSNKLEDVDYQAKETEIVFTGPPGEYKIDAVITTGSDSKRLPSAKCTITKETGDPTNDPTNEPESDLTYPELSKAGKNHSLANANLLDQAANSITENSTKQELINLIGPKRTTINAAFAKALDTAIDPELDPETGKFKGPVAVKNAKLKLKTMAQGMRKP